MLKTAGIQKPGQATAHLPSTGRPPPSGPASPADFLISPAESVESVPISPLDDSSSSDDAEQPGGAACAPGHEPVGGELLWLGQFESLPPPEMIEELYVSGPKCRPLSIF